MTGRHVEKLEGCLADLRVQRPPSASLESERSLCRRSDPPSIDGRLRMHSRSRADVAGADRPGRAVRDVAGGAAAYSAAAARLWLRGRRRGTTTTRARNSRRRRGAARRERALCAGPKSVERRRAVLPTAPLHGAGALRGAFKGRSARPTEGGGERAPAEPTALAPTRRSAASRWRRSSSRCATTTRRTPCRSACPPPAPTRPRGAGVDRRRRRRVLITT